MRAAREAVLAGRPEEADAFFADEYAMNGDDRGLCQAGGRDLPTASSWAAASALPGMPISASRRRRVRFAMPEAAIGFVSDVGVNAILAQAPLHRALLFLMTRHARSARPTRWRWG